MYPVEHANKGAQAELQELDEPCWWLDEPEK